MQKPGTCSQTTSREMEEIRNYIEKIHPVPPALLDEFLNCWKEKRQKRRRFLFDQTTLQESINLKNYSRKLTHQSIRLVI
jgi:hypothetical protein